MKTTTPWPLLGGLRFVLACIVVAEHLHWFLPHPAVAFVRLFGPFAAVVGFLFISGYSIAASYERAPRGFYRRRLRRIYPWYALALLLSLVPFLISGRALLAFGGIPFPRPSAVAVLGNALFLQGFAVPSVGGDNVVWSLAVEVACYALAPLFARFRWLALAALPSFAFFVVARGPLHLPHYAFMSYGLAFAALLWAWLAGFVFYRYRAVAWAQIGLVMLASCALTLNRTDALRFSIPTLVSAALALVYAPHIPLPPRLARVLTVLGDASYPLYLLHIPVLLLVSVATIPA